MTSQSTLQEHRHKTGHPVRTAFPKDSERQIPAILPARSAYATWGWRAFNAALLLGSLPAALLLGLPIALAIKLESWGSNQSVFFRQRRVGLDGKIFNLLKFRTMNSLDHTVGCEFKSWGEGDSQRTTRIGNFLRKSHLDEIPQLLNVLKGEMAVIGPRPEMVAVSNWAESNVPLFTSRLSVLPGITGWAQVYQGYCGQDIESYQDKLALDLEYARERTLRMDIKIIALTSRTMTGLKGWGIEQKAS